MPEGHTLHRLTRALRPLVGGRVRASSPQGRFAEGARVVDGRVLEDVDAYGKHLLADFGDVHLHVHLDLAGAMFESEPADEPSRGVRLRLVAVDPPTTAWDLVAPLRCELMAEAERKELLARLGPDPLRGDDPTPAFERLRASRRAIGVDRSAIDQTDGRYVYKQERCRTCGGMVRTWALGNRRAYACEHCRPAR